MMQSIKKTLFGYDPTQTNQAFKELNDEILSLRQELFMSDKKLAGGSINEQTENELRQLRNETQELREQLAARDNVIAQLRAVVPAAASDIRQEADSLRAALASKDEELATLQEALAKTQAQQAPVHTSSASLKMIEAVYVRAFHGAKDIACDAKNSITQLTDRVIEDLNANVMEAAAVHAELMLTRQKIQQFLTQGYSHLQSMESLLESIPDEDIKTADHMESLRCAREQIVTDIEQSAGYFAQDLDDHYSFESVHTAPVTSASAIEPLQPAPPQPVPPQPVPLQPVPLQPVSAATSSAATPAEVPAVPTALVADDHDITEILSPGAAEDNDEMYHPEDELKSMKEAIQREYMAGKPSAGSASPAPEAPTEKPAFTPKPKVNIQDILKKYSNLNM